MPMLDRIVADVIEIMMSVLLVSNHMLPIPPLSDASFPLAPPADGNAFAMREHSRETGLDQAAAHWKVIVPRRQAPQARQVVRQYRHGLDHKRMRLLCHVQCFAQCIDVLGEQDLAMALGQMHREKVSCSGCMGACAGAHRARIAGIAFQPTALVPRPGNSSSNENGRTHRGVSIRVVDDKACILEKSEVVFDQLIRKAMQINERLLGFKSKKNCLDQVEITLHASPLTSAQWRVSPVQVEQ